jgi:hypothetical protein
MEFTIMLLIPVTLSHHDINSPRTTMVFLGRMKGQDIVQLRQPFGEVAFQLGDTIRITLALAMKNDDGPQAIAHAITDEPEDFATGLLNGHTVQIKAGFDRILAQPELSKYAVLDAWPLPAQDIVGRKRLYHVGSQGIGVPRGLFNSRPLTFQMAWRQFPGRCHLGPVGLADTPDVFHFLKEAEALFFGSHGVTINDLFQKPTLPPG